MCRGSMPSAWSRMWPWALLAAELSWCVHVLHLLVSWGKGPARPHPHAPASLPSGHERQTETRKELERDVMRCLQGTQDLAQTVLLGRGRVSAAGTQGEGFLTGRKLSQLSMSAWGPRSPRTGVMWTWILPARLCRTKRGVTRGLRHPGLEFWRLSLPFYQARHPWERTASSPGSRHCSGSPIVPPSCPALPPSTCRPFRLGIFASTV